MPRSGYSGYTESMAPIRLAPSFPRVRRSRTTSTEPAAIQVAGPRRGTALAIATRRFPSRSPTGCLPRRSTGYSAVCAARMSSPVWGGDELIVLAPDLDSASALGRFGERLRSVISDSPFVLGGLCEIDATASVGGTLIDGSTTPEVALKRADVAVYRAKEERNASVVEAPATSRIDVRSLVPALRDRR